MKPEIPALDSIRHVHLVAIAGTGMGSLACMLAENGFRVTGSDLDTYPPMSDQLQRAEIPVYKGFAAEHVLQERPDLVVIGNAVRRDNPEVKAVFDHELPYISFPDAVHHFFIRAKHSIVITGTHGKTTCTSIVGWILTHAGLDPSVLIGGVAQNLGCSFRLGAGDHFVIEGDEYDTAFFDKTPKFLHYDARSVLFTSCEFDHADIYESIEEIKAEFRSLIESLPPDGRVVAATDAPHVRAVLQSARVPVEGYGFQEDAMWRATDVAFDDNGTSFTIWRNSERVGQVAMPLFGRHNVENVLGATALCHDIGVGADQVAAAMAEFQGVRRRQEIRGEEAGCVVIDDFAHHPTAVRETLSGMRSRFHDRSIWAIFEPRTNTSRRRFFEDEFVDALSGADHVIIAGVYRPDQIPTDERMRPERVIDALKARGVDAVYIPEVDEIIEHVVANRTGSDAALIMSNGSFGGIWDRLLARLRAV